MPLYPLPPLPGSDSHVHARSKGERTARHAIKTRQAAQPLLHSKDYEGVMQINFVIKILPLFLKIANLFTELCEIL